MSNINAAELVGRCNSCLGVPPYNVMKTLWYKFRWIMIMPVHWT